MTRRHTFAAYTLLAVTATSMLGCASTDATRVARPLPPASPNEGQRERTLRTVAGFKNLGFQVVMARLRLGIDTALAWRQLDTLVARPTGDIFWMYPATGFYLHMKPRLDEVWRARFRRAWKTYTPYRGDTENHFLMYYASLLLMSQEYPGLPGSEWFNGKSSRENQDEAHEYIEHWIDETVRLGSTEWDSPRYAYYYITPLILLRDFVADDRLRRKCELMLELTLADYASEYLNGSYCGAHSRDGDGSVVDPRKAEVTSYGQLYFNDSISFVLPDLAYAAMSPWICPPIIRAIAHDRDTSFVLTETKRSRARMRFADERYASVAKYAFMTPDYCLGSIDGGLHQPIQQHSWDVTFASARPNNTLFALHPTWSAIELGTYFPEDPELMIEGVARAKASYTSADKWIGGSPAERVVQDRGSLVAVYDIPADDAVQHVDVFVPTTADTIVHHASGWYFVRFGEAMAAVHPIGDVALDTVQGYARRLRLVAGRSARPGRIAVLVTCARTRDASFERFVAAVSAGPVRASEEDGVMRWEFTDGTAARRSLGIAEGAGGTGGTGEGIEGLRGGLDRPGDDGGAANPTSDVPGRPRESRGPHENGEIEKSITLSGAGGARGDQGLVGAGLGASFVGPHVRQEPGSLIVELHALGHVRILDFSRGHVPE